MGLGVEDFGTPGAVETKFSLRLIYTQYIPKLIYLLAYSMVAQPSLSPLRSGRGGGGMEMEVDMWKRNPSFLNYTYLTLALLGYIP